MAPDEDIVYLNLAWFYEEQNNFQAAARALHSALSVSRPNLSKKTYINLSRISRKTGNYAKALSAIEPVLREDPDNLEALLAKAVIYEELDRHQEALALYQKAYDLGMRSADFYNNWGKTCFSLGMTEKAVANFKLALEFNPDHKDSHYNLGVAYGSMGLVEKARQEMRLGM